MIDSWTISMPEAHTGPIAEWIELFVEALTRNGAAPGTIAQFAAMARAIRDSHGVFRVNSTALVRLGGIVHELSADPDTNAGARAWATDARVRLERAIGANVVQAMAWLDGDEPRIDLMLPG